MASALKFVPMKPNRQNADERQQHEKQRERDLPVGKQAQREEERRDRGEAEQRAMRQPAHAEALARAANW